MSDKIKQFVLKLNSLGIPLPYLMDPKTKSASVSLSMLVISFTLVVVGLVGKWAKVLDIDLQQALYFFMTCSGLYFSRRISSTTNGPVLGDQAQTTESSK